MRVSMLDYLSHGTVHVLLTSLLRGTIILTMFNLPSSVPVDRVRQTNGGRRYIKDCAGGKCLDCQAGEVWWVPFVSGCARDGGRVGGNTRGFSKAMSPLSG